MARLAWRNNARCIGRLFWESLCLFDARTAGSPEEVFEACVRHLQYATNGGRIRTAVTVFAEAEPEEKGIRIWNTQLIRYAGYRAADGTIRGDPSEVAFTERVMEMGWQPPRDRSAYDVLPLVVDFPGHAPRWFELPKHAVLEVPISHPEFGWFAGLGLKWHAVPAVSDRALVGGGHRFTAAPFSGYYVGTEIGSRNFGDEGRYNLLPIIAERRGLIGQNAARCGRTVPWWKSIRPFCIPSARPGWSWWIITPPLPSSCNMWQQRRSAAARCPATGRGWCRQCPAPPVRSSTATTTTPAPNRLTSNRSVHGEWTV
jgi:nitric oxide synthase oxygenase domain/subunit